MRLLLWKEPTAQGGFDVSASARDEAMASSTASFCGTCEPTRVGTDRRVSDVYCLLRASTISLEVTSQANRDNV